MNYQVTAFDLKLALLRYFRFERQWICVDEFRGADVIVDTGQDIIEVEVKVSKYDLEKGEEKKHRKHDYYRVGQSVALCHPNKFYFCVPEALVKTAFEVCDRLNPKYGIVAFNHDAFERHIQWDWGVPHMQCLRMARTGKKLHETYARCQEAIAKRTVSKIITLMETDFRTRLQNSKGD